MAEHPSLIQGGMGIAVSDWKLARTVSLAGGLGVVSGTAINTVLVRRLQDGDPQGLMRKALAAFPVPEIAESILKAYFIEGGKAPGVAYKRSPMFQIEAPIALLQLNVVANFAEVYLAKEGHSGAVGINLLEKVQMPNLSALYGAMLAGVDYVLMGAGIPREIPGALDLMSQHLPATLKIPVVGMDEDPVMTFIPEKVMGSKFSAPLKRPYFFPIVSSAVLASSLKKKSTGEVNGFIVEGPLAGGHNAPPRGPLKLSEKGEPVYGPRDEVSLKDMAELGLPFWLAGSVATPERYREALQAGATGIQVGTLFAFCEESGLATHYKREVIARLQRGSNPRDGWVFTDPTSSPTGFPFKAVRLTGSVSEKETYESRKRICDLGYLRHAYQDANGKISMRCPAEPVADYVKKGGAEADTIGRKCLCNALMANIGQAQVQSGGTELPLLTAGDDLNQLHRILQPGADRYTVQDVFDYLDIQKAQSRVVEDSHGTFRRSSTSVAL